MDFQFVVDWFNANEGAATVIGSILTVMMGGVGWLISKAITRREPAPLPNPVEKNANSKFSTLDTILSLKTIKIGCLHYPPFMSVTKKGDGVDISGLYVEILNEACSQLEIKIQWIVIRWSEIIDDLRSGKVDVVASVFLTSRRSKQADFFGFMHRVGVAGLCKISENRIERQQDLLNPDLKIGVVSGEIGWEYAIDNLGMGLDSKRFKVIDEYDISSIAELLEFGIVDIVLADCLTCNLWLKSSHFRNENFKMILDNDKLYFCDNGFMARKNETEFCEWMENNIRLARNSQRIRDLEIETMNLVGRSATLRKF